MERSDCKYEDDDPCKEYSDAERFSFGEDGWVICPDTFLDQ